MQMLPGAAGRHSQGATDGKTPRHDKTNRRRFVVPFHQPIRRHRRRDKSQQPE
jgi:hypothetical protein